MQYVTEAVYNQPSGQMSYLTLANGMHINYSYDAAFRLNAITAGASVFQELYEYDPASNLVSILDVKNSFQRQTFVYDSLNRLVSAQTDQKGGGQYSETYAYDPVGNLVNKGDDCYGYWQEDCGVPGDSVPREMKPHAVTHLNGVQKFWYDANGNMTRRIEGSVTYEQTFNSENRLSSVAVGGSTTTFIYDADGNRIQTIEPDGTTTTYPFPGYEEAVHNGAVTRRTTYSLGGQAVALRVQGPGSENNLYYLITDRLGSTRLVLSEGGSAVPGSTARYLPFGDWRTEPMVNLTDRGFTGHMQDNLGSNDLGLIYMRARFFVPALGRFASADTIVPNPANPQALNRYSYGYNEVRIHAARSLRSRRIILS